jgi:hypothetical protein
MSFMRKFLSLSFIAFLLSASLLDKAVRRVVASDCSKASVGFLPLNSLGAGLYKGKQGGLYPSGSNVRPAAHAGAGFQLARSISALDANGQPNANGRIVLISVGMSNTTQEFSTFKPMADADVVKNPRLVIVDGAQGGMSADRISDLNTASAQQYWQTVDQRLSAAGVTPAQVQVAWVKEADPGPTLDFPNDALRLKDELANIARILKTRYPNIRLAYYSSRIYAGYASSNLNPEPFAYQSGFAVKWLIEDQINGLSDLNFDPSRGTVKAPWLSWGPYMWADGMTPRSDGLTWVCSDFQSDGTHPSSSGAQKVAQMLLSFFKSDSTTTWFLNPANRTASLLTREDDLTRAVALDSVTMMRDPFPIVTLNNFSADQRTRLVLFAVNLELLPGEDSSAVTVQAEDSSHRIYSLPVEYVGTVPNFDWMTQIVVKLPDEIANAGDVWVSISLRSAASNKALVSVRTLQ